MLGLEEWRREMQTSKTGTKAFRLLSNSPLSHGGHIVTGDQELCFTTLSLAMETMRMRLSVVKQSFFGPPGQYGRLVTRANVERLFMT